MDIFTRFEEIAQEAIDAGRYGQDGPGMSMLYGELIIGAMGQKGREWADKHRMTDPARSHLYFLLSEVFGFNDFADTEAFSKGFYPEYGPDNPDAGAIIDRSTSTTAFRLVVLLNHFKQK